MLVKSQATSSRGPSAASHQRSPAVRSRSQRRPSGAQRVGRPLEAVRHAVLANLKTRQLCGLPGRTVSTKSPDVYDRMTSLQNGSPARFASETRTTQCPGTLSQSAMAAWRPTPERRYPRRTKNSATSKVFWFVARWRPARGEGKASHATAVRDQKCVTHAGSARIERQCLVPEATVRPDLDRKDSLRS